MLDDELYDDEPYGIAVGPAYTEIPQRYAELYEKAACKGGDVAKWFTGTYKGPNRQVGEASLNAEAVKVCHRCPVKKLCGEFAIETEPPFGIYAGRPACDWKRVVDGKPMRRTCDRCGRRRMDRFFPDAETPICIECLNLPPDDELVELFDDLPDDAIGDVLGLDGRDVYRVKMRLLAKGRLPVRWSKGGRPRIVPSDWELMGLFDRNLSLTDLASLLGVARSTVHYHRRRLAS
jgi:hypothetical protein